MRNKLKKALKFVKDRKILVGGAAVAVIIIVIFVTGGNGASSYDFIVVSQRDVNQGVSITGQVKPVYNVDLAFEQTGTIAQVLVDIGDNVTEGQTLITLRNGDIVALLNQAQAQADFEQAELTNLKNNADAEQDLQNSYDDVINTINDALTQAEDAVRSKTSGLFSGSASSGYNLTFSTCSVSIGVEAKTLRLTAELELDNWGRELKILSTNSPQTDLDTALSNAQDHLNVVEQFVDATNRALLTKCAIENATLSTGRTNMVTAQTNVFTAINNINNLKQTIASDKITADNNNDLNAQEAKVRAAEASVDNYRAQLVKTIIRSPITGVVTKQDASVGETVSLNVPIVSVISDADFEIEANIPEVEIAKVTIGVPARVTLDAYGDEEPFPAHVVMIDPAETIVSGVPNYRTTLIFDNKDDRIKSGMTANIQIILEGRSSVIAVPRGAITTNGNNKTVQVLIGKRRGVEAVEVEVETGITGADGFTEITRGLSVGDRVILP